MTTQLLHLNALDAQLHALESEIAQIARSELWSDPVRWLCAFRGIAELSARRVRRDPITKISARA
jgi:hypothetical protein